LPKKELLTLQIDVVLIRLIPFGSLSVFNSSLLWIMMISVSFLFPWITRLYMLNVAIIWQTDAQVATPIKGSVIIKLLLK